MALFLLMVKQALAKHTLWKVTNISKTKKEFMNPKLKKQPKMTPSVSFKGVQKMFVKF